MYEPSSFQDCLSTTNNDVAQERRVIYLHVPRKLGILRGFKLGRYSLLIGSCTSMQKSVGDILALKSTFEWNNYTFRNSGLLAVIVIIKWIASVQKQ